MCARRAEGSRNIKSYFIVNPTIMNHQ
jgi:hypothetical protein